jgi:hypothetical protein
MEGDPSSDISGDEELGEGFDISGVTLGDDAFGSSSEEDDDKDSKKTSNSVKFNLSEVRCMQRFRSGDTSILSSPSLWTDINPQLSCSMSLGNKSSASLSTELKRELKSDLVEDGFFEIEADQLPFLQRTDEKEGTALSIDNLSAGMQRIVSLGWHPCWILMYDEPWLMASQLSDALLTITGGNQMIMDWFAWCIDPCGKTRTAYSSPVNDSTCKVGETALRFT